MSPRGVIGTAAALAIASIACLDYTEAPALQGTCSTSAWQGGVAHSVACPGADGCSCTAPAVCCMQTIDALGGSCTDPRACAGVAIACDGPEDCASGSVCCLGAQGSTCVDTGTCAGTLLCRSDSNCAGHGSCVPADFGQQGIQDRGYDGVIGVCK